MNSIKAQGKQSMSEAERVDEICVLRRTSDAASHAKNEPIFSFSLLQRTSAYFFSF